MSCSCSSYGTYIGNLNCPGIPIPNLGIPCPPLTSVGTSNTDSVFYTGPDLSCSAIVSGDSLTTIINKIDSQLCSVLGDFTTFNTFCLGPISTLQQFVETISEFVCNTDDTVDTFINTTFVDYQTDITNQLSAITDPQLTLCASSGIDAGDNLVAILTKLANSICDIYDNQLDLSGVDWSNCFVVSTPTTVAEGFDTVLEQICQLNTYIGDLTAGGTLPTFNTLGTCLPSPSATDTLVDTVGKLIVRTCQAPTFDINALTWGCITKPSTDTTDLQDAFQTVLSTLTTMTQNTPAVYSSDFVLTNVDNLDPCQGKILSLSTSLVQDRFVAATGTDLAPGTLQDKLDSSGGITLDYFITPGKVTIIGSDSAGDHKVLSDPTDVTPGYLIDKVESGTTIMGITILPQLDGTSNKVMFNLSIDPTALFSALLNLLVPGDAITAQFCAAISACPSPCAPPSNVTVTYNAVGSTTTTTTTT